jgi:hypothetical protein
MCYNDAIEGVLVSFDAVEFKDKESARIIADQPNIIVDITATFLYFKPGKNEVLQGTVMHIGEDFVELLVYGLFHAHIKLRDLNDPASVTLGDAITFKMKSSYIENTLNSSTSGTSGTSKPNAGGGNLRRDLLYTIRGSQK